MLAAVLAAACSDRPSVPAAEAAPAAAADLRALTGAPTRVVWVQHDGSDPLAQGSALTLMGVDTEDGRGERALIPKPGSYTKPLLTMNGDRVIVSNRQSQDVLAVAWDGSGAQRVAAGFALAIWSDPSTRAEWLYVGRDRVEDAFRRVVRFPIDRPAAEEVVWDKSLVGEDTFQVSRDGRLASGMFPWPNVGVATLPNGELRQLGDGCWTALAAFDRPVCWYLDGAHRNLTLVDVNDGRRWRIAINEVPGFGNAEVYHPRWPRDPRVMVMTGPYNLGGDNQVRGGGPQVEVYVGRFSTDLSRIESWARVTNNKRADAFPDVWIGGGPAAASPDGGRPAAAATGANPGRAVVEVRVASASTIPSPNAILPYRHALVVTLYDVTRVVEGTAVGSQVLVAEWAIRDSKVLPGARRTRGDTATLTVERYDAHPELEGERLVMDPGLPSLPIYYAESRP